MKAKITAPPLPDLTVHDTLPKLLALHAREHGDEIAIREKQFGIWRVFTWAEIEARVRALTLGLRELSVGVGDVIGLIGDNRPDWIMGEVAVHALGGLSLGIYRDALDEEVAYLITYAGVKLVFAEDEEQVEKLLGLGDLIGSVQHIIYSDSRGMRKYADHRLMPIGDLIRLGEMAENKSSWSTPYEALVRQTKGSDVAILCTTSGTTANPKLAMLPAAHLVRHCASYLAVDPKGSTDEYVSILPLPWIMEQVYAVGMWMVSRMRVNFVEEPATMMQDFRAIGPSFVLFAPRLWEAIAADVRARMMDASPFKRKMFGLGVRLGLEAVGKGRRSRIADWILFRALRDRLGFTNLKSAATGGAALGPDTFRFFQAIGVPLRQIYGQTETMGAYTVHRSGDVDFETVGMPFNETIEIKVVDPDQNGIGCVVTRHPNMFTGYYKDETATDLRDGWMQTGDAGFFDRKGHLVVIDRMKDLAATVNGERFSPQYIENKLKFSPYVAEAVVLGDSRDFLAAIICIRFPIVSKWAEKRRIAFTTYADLSAKPQVTELLRAEVERVNAGLPEFQRIAKFLLLYKELDADDGELTRTRKVRRGVIAEKYAAIIDAVYMGEERVAIDAMIAFQDGTRQRVRTTIAVLDLAPDATHKSALAAA